ncbi:hypothetical protein ACS0TY_031638 [Phlomoides rotata]
MFVVYSLRFRLPEVSADGFMKSLAAAILDIEGKIPEGQTLPPVQEAFWPGGIEIERYA